VGFIGPFSKTDRDEKGPIKQTYLPNPLKFLSKCILKEAYIYEDERGLYIWRWDEKGPIKQTYLPNPLKPLSKCIWKEAYIYEDERGLYIWRWDEKGPIKQTCLPNPLKPLSKCIWKEAYIYERKRIHLKKRQTSAVSFVCQIVCVYTYDFLSCEGFFSYMWVSFIGLFSSTYVSFHEAYTYERKRIRLKRQKNAKECCAVSFVWR